MKNLRGQSESVDQEETYHSPSYREQSEGDRTYSAEEAAQYLKLKQSYLYQIVNRGQITYNKPLGGKLVFRRSDLYRFIDRGRHLYDFELHERAEQIALGSLR